MGDKVNTKLILPIFLASLSAIAYLHLTFATVSHVNATVSEGKHYIETLRTMDRKEVEIYYLTTKENLEYIRKKVDELHALSRKK